MEYIICTGIVLISWYLSALFVQQTEKKSYITTGLYKIENEHKDLRKSRVFGYRVNKRIFVFAVLILILLVGLRGMSVGWDTAEYYSLFLKVSNQNSIKDLISYKLSGATSQEWGFLVYTWLCAKFLNFQLFLLISVSLYLIPAAIYIYRYSDDVFFGLFLFMTYGMYTFAFSTVRQCVAMGFCLLAIILGEEQKKLWKYIIFVAIAVLMHRTALIFVPAILYKKIRINKLSIVSIIAVAAVCYRFRSSILLFLLGYARNAGSYIETEGTFQYLFIIGIIVLGIINLKSFIIDNKERNRNQFLFVCMCIVAVIFPVLKQNPTYFRLYYYNYMFMAVYVPNVLSSLKNRQVRWGIKVCLFCLGIFMLYKQIVLTTNPLLPYLFFWQ